MMNFHFMNTHTDTQVRTKTINRKYFSEFLDPPLKSLYKNITLENLNIFSTLRK